MNYPSALQALRAASSPDSFSTSRVGFVSPVLSAVVAAAVERDRQLRHRFTFNDAAASYARTNGLQSVLDGSYRSPSGAGLQGRTYSALTRLRTAEDVESCNQHVGQLLRAQLGRKQVAADLVAVVGELHDNVVSHAGGAGFSAAQVFRNSTNKNKWVEFCIADIGCGLLRKIQGAGVQNVTSPHEAIRWCLEAKNTTAGRLDSMAQRMPEDHFGASPVPGPTYRDERGNHHLGLGLHKLQKLIGELGGQIWMFTDTAQAIISAEKIREFESRDDDAWNGLVIEFQVEVPEQPAELRRHPASDGLAQRLGLDSE